MGISQGVAIPSNRVNVSYTKISYKTMHKYCRNPLKSGQCFLHIPWQKPWHDSVGRNPLKSGQCFLQRLQKQINPYALCRNPLKSGQCFLLSYQIAQRWVKEGFNVAIPSNRVNVSYKY